MRRRESSTSAARAAVAKRCSLSLLVCGLSLFNAASVATSTQPWSVFVPVLAKVTETPFGTTPDGAAVRLFTLTNAAGMEVRATTYGVILVSIRVPDRQGRLDDIVIGHENLEGYLTKSRYFGAVVGRYGNRIAGGKVTIDGHAYQLTLNNGPNHLHGGTKGFDKVVWDANVVNDARGPSVVFTHTSPDGHEGYPGTLAARVAYTLTDANELIVEYSATTDKPTIVNITQHSYFNLAGDGSGDITNHRITLHADRYTPVDGNQIPTGELASVAGTPFDLRSETRIGDRIDADDAQLKGSSGFDHNFVLVRKGPRPRAGGPSRRSRHRPHDGGLHDRAGHPVLHRQQARWLDGGEGRPRLQGADRPLPRDAALSRLAKQAELPVYGPSPRRAVPVDDGVQVRGVIASPTTNRRSRDQEVRRLEPRNPSDLLIF